MMFFYFRALRDNTSLRCTTPQNFLGCSPPKPKALNSLDNPTDLKFRKLSDMERLRGKAIYYLNIFPKEIPLSRFGNPLHRIWRNYTKPRKRISDLIATIISGVFRSTIRFTTRRLNSTSPKEWNRNLDWLLTMDSILRNSTCFSNIFQMKSQKNHRHSFTAIYGRETTWFRKILNRY